VVDGEYASLEPLDRVRDGDPAAGTAGRFRPSLLVRQSYPLLHGPALLGDGPRSGILQSFALQSFAIVSPALDLVKAGLR
jgi:hypothetical protein